MVVYLYRWRVKAAKEEQFVESWSFITRELRSHCGSLGSRLHKGDDGFYYGYAQWPSIAVREGAHWESPEMNNARVLMKDAIEESYPDVLLEPIADYLIQQKAE